MSLAVSSIAKSYYNVYALTNSDTYKNNAVDSSAVSKSKYNVADASQAFDMLSSESNFSTIGSVGSYAKDLFKLSQIKDTGTSEMPTDSVVSLLASDTDMFSLLDTSAANTAKVKEALSGPAPSSGSQTNNAISAYSGIVSAYKQYLEKDSRSIISFLL
jgi:hypothetical protein